MLRRHRIGIRVIVALTIMGLIGTGVSVAFLLGRHRGDKARPGSTFIPDTR